MPDFGVIYEGFNRKRLPEILAEINAGAKSVFGQDLDTSSQSPEGQYHGIFSDALAEVWEIAEAVYHSFDIDQAEGVRLQALAAMLGIPPAKDATKTRITATVTGTPNTVIPAGSKARETYGNKLASLAASVVIGANGTATAVFFADDAGAVPFLAGSLTQIASPVVGWATVTNAEDGVLGAAKETDAQVRLRVKRGQLPKSPVDALKADLLALPNALAVEVYTCCGFASFNPVIYGNVAAQSIGTTIWDHQPMGACSEGAQSVQVLDARGHCRTLHYDSAEAVPIYIKIDYSLCFDPACGCKSLATVNQQLAGAINNPELACDGYRIGRDVYAKDILRLAQTLHKNVLAVTISSDGINFTNDRIVIGDKQVAVFDVSRVRECLIDCS